MNTRERFFYTVHFLDRFGGLRTGSYREDFGYQERSLPRTDGLEPEGVLDREYVVDRFSPEIRDEPSTVLVDVGCHSGIRFTADFAREKPKIAVVGIDVSFSPENFNNDANLGYRTFRTREEVLRYLKDLHAAVGNLRLEEARFEPRYPLSAHYNGGQRILTGFRSPGIVGADLVQQAAATGVDIVLSTPINLPELVDRSGKDLEAGKNGRRYPYKFPLSDYAKKFGIDTQLLHKLINAPHTRRKEGDRFVPETHRDEHNMIVSIVAKQLICLDRCLFLEERGFKTELWRYTDGDEGPYAPHHLIVGRKV